MSRSIRTTWLSLLLSLSLLPLLIVGGIVSWNTYRHEQEHALEFQRTVMGQAIIQLSTFIGTATGESRLIVQTPSFIGAVRPRQEDVLTQALFYRNIFDDLALLDANGQETARASRLGVVPVDQLRNRAGDGAFLQTMKQNKPWYGTVYLSPITGEALLPLAVPVVDAGAGKPIGVLIAQVRMHQIFETVANIQFGEQGTLEIVTADGLMVAHRDPKLIGTRVNNLIVGDGVHLLGAQGVSALISHAPLILDDTSIFFVVGEIPVDEALAPAYTQIATIAALMLISALVATAIGVVAVRRLTRPIQALDRATHMISAGDLTQRVAVTARDEIGSLQGEFNKMAQSLSEQRESLAARNTELQSALAEVRDRAAAQDQLIRENVRQREVIRELSIPVLPVGADTLVMPLVGVLDAERLRDFQERALQATEQMRAGRLLIDVTGVAVIDDEIAQGLIHVMQAAHLLGSSAALVGIRPEVAQALVGLGVDLQDVHTFKDLRTALDRPLVARR
ncbi:MAG: cache domain-containing protein [Chloroflexales bacterium]